MTGLGRCGPAGEAPLWTAEAAARATCGWASGWSGVTGVAIDTRTIAPGDLFVALAGESRDGHDFAAEALAKGAGAAMLSHRPDGVAGDAPVLMVNDTRTALEALGAAARARTRAKVLAVTGSVGKTSTKEMLAAMLAAQGRVHAAERSFNNHWGVPLTLARMPAETDYAVLEIGMNHAGEIRPLSRLARPHVALITAVAAVHLAAFDSVEAIADAKAEIFAGLEPGGTAVLNCDDAHFERLAAAAGSARIWHFGADPAADIQLIEARIAGEATVVRARLEGRPIAFKIGQPGRHFAENALGALAAAIAAGADAARAVLALAGWTALAGRGARHRIELGPAGLDGEITLIDESYNANPASLRAALAVLGAAPVTDDIGRVARGRRIAFLGDMLELGETAEALHAGIADLPELGSVDLVHCCGPLMQALHEALPREKRGLWFPDSRGLAARARRMVDAGDVCMVKGSKGSAMGPVVAAIRSLGHAAADAAEEA